MADGKILIVDDEEQLRKLLKRIISLEGYDVYEAASLQLATAILRSQEIDIVLCDVKLTDGNGVDFSGTLKTKFPFLEVILLTAYGNIPDGVQAMKNGAFDYLEKGNDNKRILPLLSQAMGRVTTQKRELAKPGERPGFSFSDILGESPVILQAVKLAQKAAVNDTTVLLLGETGTGKEVFAGAIHQAGKRKHNNFVAVNCSSFSKDLLEGELFGHKAGAYTGALKDKKGLIEVADKGTLFLDEIGEMNTDLQAKLLRVLENGEFIKLGDVKTTKADVRIIAATNRDLEQEVATGRFREDLYYRLNVLSIQLPPLRERLEDIPVLANYLLIKITSKLSSIGPVHISPEAMQLLKLHNWKGNIRELRNVLERAAVISGNTTIVPADLPFEVQKQLNKTKDLSLASTEKLHIQKVLAYSKGNKTETARLLDIGLSTLYRKLEEYKLYDKSEG